MAELNQTPKKPSVHTIKAYIKERTQMRNANNRVIGYILPEYSKTLNARSIITPEAYVELNKKQLIDGLLKELELIETRQTKLTSSERRAVVDLWIKFSREDGNKKEDDTKERSQIN